jgi:hypothetical protein
MEVLTNMIKMTKESRCYIKKVTNRTKSYSVIFAFVIIVTLTTVSANIFGHIQSVIAQVDCNANPNDPSCQSSGSNNQQTCPDGSQPDSNGNCPNQSQSQQQQPQQTDTRTQICNALHVKDIGILAPLLVALHLIILGASTVAILGAAAAYCSS